MPPNRGMSTGAIVAIIVVPVALLLLVVFGIALVGAFAARSAKHAARLAPPKLTETYATTNGLATAHYPAEFSAKSIDDASIAISKSNYDGSDEFVQVAAVPNPISNDVNEFGRILENAMKKNIEDTGDHWTETSRTHRACFKSHPGLAIEGSFVAKGVTKEKVRICFFMNGNTGYELKSMVPEKHEAEDLHTLQSIIDATDLR